MGKPVPVLSRPERRPPPAPVAVDDPVLEVNDYEDALIGLLFRVEHLRDGIFANLTNGRPAGAVALSGELLDHVARFADEHCELATEAEMAEPAARAGAFREFIAPLRTNPQPTLQQVCVCLTALHEAVFAAFVAFTNRFPTSRSGWGWVEVAAIFTVEFKRSIDEALEMRDS